MERNSLKKVALIIFILLGFSACNLSDSAEDGGGLFAQHRKVTNLFSLIAPSAKTYRKDSEIIFTLEHSNIIDISGGIPFVQINIGGIVKNVPYFSGAGSKKLKFKYTVIPGDNDDDGILIDGEIYANGASLTFFNGATTQDANLEYTTKDTSGVLVDTIPAVSITNPGDIDFLNESDFKVTGTCSENGRTVALNIGGQTYNPNCSGLTWSSGFIDVSGIAEGPVLVRADHSNIIGQNAPQASLTITKDTSFVAVTISSAPNINVSNESIYVISGSCSESGRVVTVNVDAFTFTPTCSGGQTWTTGQVDISAIADSTNITVTADHTSAGGDNALQASRVISKSTGPSISGLSVPTTLSASANLDWTLVTPGGYTIDDYAIEYRVFGTSLWVSFTDGVNTDQFTTVTGLTASTNYQFRVRVLYDSGSYSDWSNIATGETQADDALFGPNTAMNVGGATASVVTAHFNGTTVTLNGNPLVTLNRGETHSFTSAPFDVIDADKAIFTAGKAGTGTGTGGGNIVWNPVDWAGRNFSFNATRSNPQVLTVYAIEDTYIEVKQGSTVLDSATITKGNSDTLTWSVYGSYQVNATGSILAFHMSRSGGSYTDPKPLMPGHTQIIGFPSSSMRLTTNFNSTNYTFIHANSVSASGSISKANAFQINPQGTSSLYQSRSLLINADKKISGASFADSNGNCASPFVPTSLMKKKYIINVSADYVAFASTSPGTIEVRDASNTLIETLTLSRSGANTNAPYYARRGTSSAGYRFIASTKVAGWYQPNTNTGAADQDETVLYGTND